jgi:hypothetical protein
MGRHASNDKLTKAAMRWADKDHARGVTLPEGVQFDQDEMYGIHAPGDAGMPRHVHYWLQRSVYSVILSIGSQNHTLAWVKNCYVGGSLAGILADAAVLYFRPWRQRGEGLLNNDEAVVRDFMADADVQLWLNACEEALVEAGDIRPREEVLRAASDPPQKERRVTMASTFDNAMNTLAEKLAGVLAELAGMASTFDTAMTALAEKLTQFREEQAKMREEQAKMREEQAKMREEQANTNARLEEIEIRLAALQGQSPAEPAPTTAKFFGQESINPAQ